MKVEIATRIIYFRETEGAGIMILKLVREMKGNEFVQQLKEKYGSLDNLKRLIKKDPENVLYPLDLEDWLYHLEHPRLRLPNLKPSSLRTLKLICRILNYWTSSKRSIPPPFVTFPILLEKDLKSVQPRVHRLAREGLLKLEPGPKNAKRPVVTFNKIEIEI